MNLSTNSFSFLIWKISNHLPIEYYDKLVHRFEMQFSFRIHKDIGREKNSDVVRYLNVISNSEERYHQKLLTMDQKKHISGLAFCNMRPRNTVSRDALNKEAQILDALTSIDIPKRILYGITEFKTDDCVELIRSNLVYWHSLYLLDTFTSIKHIDEDAVSLIYTFIKTSLKWNCDQCEFNESVFFGYLKALNYQGKIPNNLSCVYKCSEKNLLKELDYNLLQFGIPEIYELIRDNLTYACIGDMYDIHKYKIEIVEDFCMIAFATHALLSNSVITTQGGLVSCVSSSILIAYVAVSICEPFYAEELMTGDKQRFIGIVESRFIKDKCIFNNISKSVFSTYVNILRKITKVEFIKSQPCLADSKKYIFSILSEGIRTTHSHEEIWKMNFDSYSFQKLADKKRGIQFYKYAMSSKHANYWQI